MTQVAADNYARRMSNHYWGPSCVALLIGGLLLSHDLLAEEKPDAAAAKRLRASAIELFDLRGRKRMELTAINPDDVGVYIYDDKGSAKLTMSLSRSKLPEVTLHGKDGRSRLVLAVLPGDRAVILSRDANGDLVPFEIPRPKK